MMTKSEAVAMMAARDNLGRVNRTSREVHPKSGIYVRYVKRLIDLAVALPVFVILLPVNALLGLLTLIDVGRPVFFAQTRTGKDGKTFQMIKFRNMTNERDQYGNLLPPSQRVTRFGKFMRKYSLDELLNFWSVIKGDMSLIGPRPLPSSFDARYSDRHRMRSSVKPGLECPSLSPDSHIRLYHEQFENDIWYVENVSFVVDVKMFIAIFRMALNFKERGDHAAAGGGEFLGYDDNRRAFSMRNIPGRYEAEYLKLKEEQQTNE